MSVRLSRFQSFWSRFRRPTKQPAARACRPNTSPRLTLESLEDRIVPAFLAQPTLISPTGVSTNTPAFSWNPVSGATYYELWVDDATLQQSQVVHNTLFTTSTAPQALTRGDTFHWWVRAYDNTNDISAWSNASTFSIPALPVPNISGPAGGVQSAFPTFSWSASAGAAAYDIWINDVTTNTVQLVRNTAVPGTTFTPPTALATGDQFEWWVRAVNGTRDQSAWSKGQFFTVVATSAPTNLAPSNPIVINNGLFLPEAFTWSASPAATSYEIWLNDNSTGTTNHYVNVLAPTTINLTSGHNYTWWVRSVPTTMDGVLSPWSSAANIQVALGAAPTPIGPLGNNFLAKPTFSWNPISGATAYDLWVDDTTTGQSQILRNTNVTATSFTPATALPQNHNFVWYVRAWFNNNYCTLWSSGNAFNVTQAPPPIVVGPQGATTNSTPTFTDNFTLNTTYDYDLWVDDTTPGQPAVSQYERAPFIPPNPGSPHLAFSFPTGAFLPGHTYTWYVRYVSPTDGTASAWTVGVVFNIVGLLQPTNLLVSISGNSPTFTWDAVVGADHYDLLLKDLTTGQAPFFRNTNISGTSINGGNSLTLGHQYEAWVRALNSSGDFSPWTIIDFTFTG